MSTIAPLDRTSQLADAFQAGAREERAAIVKWLRTAPRKLTEAGVETLAQTFERNEHEGEVMSKDETIKRLKAGYEIASWGQVCYITDKGALMGIPAKIERQVRPVFAAEIKAKRARRL